MPSYIRDVVVPNVRAGEQEEGRPEGSCEIVAAVPLALSENVPGARDAFRKEFTTYMTLPFYRTVIAGAGFGEDIARFDEALGAGDVERARAAISDRMLEEFAGIGDERVVRAKIAEYREAGVTLPAVGLSSGPSDVTAGPEATLEAAFGA
jgi:hypothetical protein